MHLMDIHPYHYVMEIFIRSDKMSVQLRSIDSESNLWNTFDAVRPHLENQYDEIEFSDETGCTFAELQNLVETYLSSHVSESPVIKKANIYRIIVIHGRIAVDPLDWFADKLDCGNILRNVCDNWNTKVIAWDLPYQSSFLNQAEKTGYFQAVLDLGHISPGWSFMLENGLGGILEKAKKCRAALGASITKDQVDFYDSLDMVYTSTIKFANRLSSLAEKMITEYPEHALRLKTVSIALKNVPEKRPSNLHEVLQFSYIMHQLIEMEGENVRAMGGFDRMLNKYYKQDIESGRLTRDQAKELIKFFWTKFFARTKGVANGKNFYFGGQDEDGKSTVNDLSYTALEAYEELKTTDPKLSVRFFKDTPEEFLYRVADIIRKGQTSFVLTNDEITIPALMKRGKSLEEARSHLLIGCYEPAVEGKEIACNMSIKINLAKGIELALNNGVDPLSKNRLGPETGDPAKFNKFNEFLHAYLLQTDYQITHAMECIKAFELCWPKINPSPVLAGTFIDCLINGKDIGQGGPKYNNTGCMGACLANAVDSLMAVKKLVFEEKRFTMKELIDILKNDFQGEEQLRQYIINRIPKWGNNNTEVDDLSRSIVNFYTDKVNNSKNNRGGSFQASMFTLDYRFMFGKVTGSLPDGRKAGVYLAPGVNAMTGMDKSGVTALINSVTKIDFTDIPNGSVMDVNLHPTAVNGREGLVALVALIKTYFQKGGYGIQFNIFDTEMLKAAQLHPEEYSTLQIRVTGWNVYFVSLSEYEQNQFIDENKHRI